MNAPLRRQSSRAILAALLLGGMPTPGADCNRNGVEDLLDVEAPDTTFHLEQEGMVEDAHSLTVLDAEGDGDIDLLTSTFSPREMVTLENDGAGRFVPGRRIPLPEAPFPRRSADMDGDADQELVIAGFSEILVLWNDRDGRFSRTKRLPVGSGPQAIEAADLDLDGDLDLLTGNFLDDASEIENISVIVNEGTGAFSPPRNFGSLVGFPLLGVGDLDVDGDPDVVVASLSHGEVLALENDGRAGFRAAGPAGSVPGQLGAVAVMDVDQDGGAEVIVSITPGYLLLMTLSDAGRLEIARKLEGSGYSPLDILSHDVSGDGRVDLVLASVCPDITLISGGGSLDRPRDIWLGLKTRNLGAGDWDRDGLEDLAGIAVRGVFTLRQSASTRSRDCNRNGTPDECEPDCDRNGVPDDCDVASGRSRDCDGNAVPDACDPDCNRNGTPDACELRDGIAIDCDANGLPDECDLAGTDGDGNGVPDSCDLARDHGLDCNQNGIHDAVDLEARVRVNVEEYDLGVWPWMGLLADMDGDGAKDIITANEGPGGVAILRQLADGSFGPARALEVVADVLALAAFDADGDGDLDLAAGAIDSCRYLRAWITVLENEGGFRLGRGPGYAVEADVWSMAAADVDGDGVDDIVASVGPSSIMNPGSIWLLSGRGDGALGLPRKIGGLGGPLALADLDGDGDSDIATGGGAVLLDGGGGVFAEGSRLGFGGMGSETRRIGAGDLDGDSDQDLLVGSFTGLELLLNDGRAHFAGAGNPAPEAATTSFALADFDGDGRPDLAAPTQYYESAVSIFLQRRDGGFSRASVAPALSSIWHLVAGDLDRDGLSDVVALDHTEAAVVLRNQGGGALRSRASFALGRHLIGADAADLDGDGDLDLAAAVWGDPEWPIDLHENDGQGSYSLRRSFLHDRHPMTLHAGDLDGDGMPDLAMTEFGESSETSTVAVLANLGDWTFGSAERRDTGEYAHRLLVADLDADGDLDIATLNRHSHDVSTFLNDGGGSLGARISTPTGTYPEDFLIARIDGDPLPDLYVIEQQGIRVLRNEGGGRFEAPWPLLELLGLTAVAVDLDGDGDDDLVLGRFAPEDCEEECWKLGIFRNIEAGTLLWSGDLPFTSTTDFLPVDIDGDGDLDLLAGAGGEVRFLTNDTGTLRPRGKVTLGSEVTFIAGRDLDGDRDPDVAFSSGSGFSILRNDTTPPALHDADRDGTPDECERAPFSRGDADQDGSLSLTDAIAMLGMLFQGVALPDCPAALDADDSGGLDITDPVRILGHLFLGRGPLPDPFGACGPDPTRDDLRCSSFGPCP